MEIRILFLAFDYWLLSVSTGIVKPKVNRLYISGTTRFDLFVTFQFFTKIILLCIVNKLVSSRRLPPP